MSVDGSATKETFSMQEEKWPVKMQRIKINSGMSPRIFLLREKYCLKKLPTSSRKKKSISLKVRFSDLMVNSEQKQEILTCTKLEMRTTQEIWNYINQQATQGALNQLLNLI
jgi:hypothetical protein